MENTRVEFMGIFFIFFVIHATKEIQIHCISISSHVGSRLFNEEDEAHV